MIIIIMIIMILTDLNQKKLNHNKDLHLYHVNTSNVFIAITLLQDYFNFNFNFNFYFEHRQTLFCVQEEKGFVEPRRRGRGSRKRFWPVNAIVDRKNFHKLYLDWSSSSSSRANSLSRAHFNIIITNTQLILNSFQVYFIKRPLKEDDERHWYIIINWGLYITSRRRFY